MLRILQVAFVVFVNLSTSSMSVHVFCRMKSLLHLRLPAKPDTSADKTQWGRLQGWKQKIQQADIRYNVSMNNNDRRRCCRQTLTSLCLRISGLFDEPTRQLSVCILPVVEAIRQNREEPDSVARSCSIPHTLLVPHIGVGHSLDTVLSHKTHASIAR